MSVFAPASRKITMTNFSFGGTGTSPSSAPASSVHQPSLLRLVPQRRASGRGCWVRTALGEKEVALFGGLFSARGIEAVQVLCFGEPESRDLDRCLPAFFPLHSMNAILPSPTSRYRLQHFYGYGYQGSKE